jgi:hypothetical protein
MTRFAFVWMLNLSYYAVLHNFNNPNLKATISLLSWRYGLKKANDCFLACWESLTRSHLMVDLRV